MILTLMALDILEIIFTIIGFLLYIKYFKACGKKSIIDHIYSQGISIAQTQYKVVLFQNF